MGQVVLAEPAFEEGPRIDAGGRVRLVEDQVAAAKSLAAAKSVQEAVELQTAWAKSALEAYIAQVSKASEIVSASIKDSVKPLNERVSAAVEKFQAAR